MSTRAHDELLRTARAAIAETDVTAMPDVQLQRDFLDSALTDHANGICEDGSSQNGPDCFAAALARRVLARLGRLTDPAELLRYVADSQDAYQASAQSWQLGGLEVRSAMLRMAARIAEGDVEPLYWLLPADWWTPAMLAALDQTPNESPKEPR